jgi:hypothetical protein
MKNGDNLTLKKLFLIKIYLNFVVINWGIIEIMFNLVECLKMNSL